MVDRHGVALIGDDYNHEYRFAGRPVLPCEVHAPANMSLVHVGTLSKLLSPSIRLGYAALDEPEIVRG